MERRIVFATGNENKMSEIRMILSDLGMPVYSMKELGVEADIVEDGIGKNNPFLWLCFSHFCLFNVFVFGCFCNLQHRSLAEFTQP